MGWIVRRIVSFCSFRSNAAISVGSTILRLVSIKRNLSGFELGVLFSHKSSSGFSNDPGNISTVIRESGIDANGLFKANVTDLACGPVLFNKIVDIPKMRKREAITALKFTERDAAPFSLTDAGADIWVLGEGGAPGKMRVMLSALSKNEILKRKGRLQNSGLNFRGVSTVTAGLSALIRHSRLIETRSTVLFVNIGDDCTGIYILKDGAPIFARETQIGAGHFSQAIAQNSRHGPDGPVELEEAQSILTNYGLPLSESWDCPRLNARKMKEYISQPLHRLESEISRSVEFYRNTRHVSTIDRALLIGEGALLKNMDGFVSETTGVDFTVYDPFDDFIKIKTGDQTGSSVSHCGPALASLAGLAIDRGRTLNVANLENRRKAALLIRRRPALAGLAALILATAMAFSIWSTMISKIDERIYLLSQEVSSLKKKSFLYENLLSRLAAAENRNRDLQDKIGSYPQLSGAGHDWNLIFHDIASSMSANSALTKCSIDFRDDAPISGLKRKRGPGGNRVRLEGIIVGANPDRIAELTQIYYRLSSSSLFHSISIGKTVRMTDENDNTEMLNFEIWADLPSGSSKLASPSPSIGRKGS
ncbi:hypothetical protein MNBD_NITROSPINAE04-2315 [hydrothermal vent metagenome]|uniref:Uncharacterized protein n=1 Tax=hydrothermal vent metagenome TaxID=652676 RepID=A0A3B1D1G1_9ZZZZ